MQIDNPERGFSYKYDGPLDLRLNPEAGISAAERLRTVARDELEGMLIENADEPYAKEISQVVTRALRKGKKEIMEMLSPLGGVYQAGTMSGNPIVMAAGLATLKQLKDHEEYYKHIEHIGKKLEEELYKVSEKYNIPISINRYGGMMTIFFTKGKVRTFEDVKKCDEERFKRYFMHMIKSGIHIPPSQFETIFLSISAESISICKNVSKGSS